MTACAMDDYLDAYALYALEPPEADVVRAHVVECTWCAAELTSLVALVDRLAQLTSEDVEMLAAETGADSRRRRPTTPAPGRIVAACVATAGAAAALAIGLSRSSNVRQPATVTAHDANARTGVSARVVLTSVTSGTAVHLSLDGAYPDGVCYLRTRGDAGQVDTAASWIPRSDGPMHVDGTTAIPIRHLVELEVDTASGRPLVRLPVPHIPR